MEKLETLELNQDELRYISASLGKLVKDGGLGLGDVLIIAPLVEKVNKVLIIPKLPEGNGFVTQDHKQPEVKK